MKHIEKLSEKVLGEILPDLFDNCIVTPQKKLDRYRIDFYVETPKNNFWIEFDGPTHFTNTKTQLRDIRVNTMIKSLGETIVRIPYFVQLCPSSIYYFFSGKANETIYSEYESGFIDPKCILPADFNQYGWDIFMNLYSDMIRKDCSSISREIFENARRMYTKDQFLGISDRAGMNQFWDIFPT